MTTTTKKMAELYTFLDGAIADIRSKIDLEYQKRLAAHEKTISEELSAEDYTPDYGKINVVDALSHFYNERYSGRPPTPCKPHITKWVGTPPHATQSTVPATDTHPGGRWFIHYIPMTTSNSSQVQYNSGLNYATYIMETTYSYSITLIDNYGLIYGARCDHTTAEKARVVSWYLDIDIALSASMAAYKHRLPNVLIDFCKKQTQNPFTGESPQFLATQYYKRFTAMKPLFTSGRFTDYESLLATKVSLDEQLATTNTQLTDATTQIATLTAEAERTNAELRSEIEQLKATMATEAKKAADRESELSTQLEAVNTDRNTLHTELKDLRISVISLADEAEVTHDAAIDAIRKKYIKIRESLEEAKAELVIAKEEIYRYHASEENYVSQLFQQRQEITTYKKQLLALDSVAPAPAPTLPSLEEIVAQAVRKALEKPTLEVSDL